MKKRVLVAIFTLVSILSFQGCKTKHKYYDINISKIGDIELTTIEEIFKKYGNYQYVRESLGYKDNSSLKELRMDFYIKTNNEKSGVPALILNPCSSEKDYNLAGRKFIPLYPDIAWDYERSNDVPETHYYFSIEKLKDLGYISNNIEEQEDLCLFTQYIYERSMSRTKEHYKSNKLVYKAEEINNIVEAYENMR